MMDNFFSLMFSPLFFIVGGPLCVIIYHVCIVRIFDQPCRKSYQSTVIVWLREQIRRISHTTQNACSLNNCSEARECAEIQKRVEDLVVQNILLQEQTAQLRFQREQTTRDSKFYNMELEDGLMQERDENERFYQHRQRMANDLHDKERSRLIQQAAQQHTRHQKERDILNDSIKKLRGENQRLKGRVERLGKRSGSVDRDTEVEAMREEANQHRAQIEILQDERAYWKAHFRQEKRTADAALEKLQGLETKSGALAMRCRELAFQNEDLRTAIKREVGKASRAREECVRLRCEMAQRQHEVARQSGMGVQFNTSIGVV